MIPGYWMAETGGELRPAIERYLRGETLTPCDIELIRAYLVQWAAAPMWIGPNIAGLRERAAKLTTRLGIKQWIEDAVTEGIDPL